MSRKGLICMVRIYPLKILVGTEINRKLVCSVLVSEFKSNLNQYHLKLKYILHFIRSKQPRIPNISSNDFYFTKSVQYLVVFVCKRPYFCSYITLIILFIVSYLKDLLLFSTCSTNLVT